MLHLALRALPAGANSKSDVDALGGMQWPVINDFRVLLLGLKFLTINKELDVWELDGDSVMMPLIVTDLKCGTQILRIYSFVLTTLIKMIKTTKKNYLRQLPSPFSWAENIEITLTEVTPQQQNESAVSHKQSVVVSIHLYKGKKDVSGQKKYKRAGTDCDHQQSK